MLRKTFYPGGHPPSGPPASMRPEQRCSGKHRGTSLGRELSAGFNEAGAAMLRKTGVGVASKGHRRFQLQ